MSEKKSLALFSGAAGLFFILLLLGAAYKQGWFEPTVSLTTQFENAEGLRVGTDVVFMGLRIGSVKSIDLNESGKIIMKLSVLKRYAAKLNSSVVARAGRTFVIGDKIITLAVTKQEASPLDINKVIPGEEALEIVDLLSGGRLSPYFKTFSTLLEQITQVIEGGGDSVKLIDVYRQAYKTLRSVEAMGDDVRTLRRDVFATPETKALLSQLSRSTKNMEAVMAEMEKALPQVGNASTELYKMVPELTQTMKETQFTFQALQKSFLLRGGVRELKEEQEKQRAPASPKKEQ